MNGKSIGTGLINEEGKIVKEIKSKVSDLTNYQNDGMGCPTLTKEQQKWMERENRNPLYDMITKLKKKSKIRRVK